MCEIVLKLPSPEEAIDLLGYLRAVATTEGSVTEADLFGAMEKYHFKRDSKMVGWSWRDLLKARVGNSNLTLPMPNYILKKENKYAHN